MAAMLSRAGIGLGYGRSDVLMEKDSVLQIMSWRGVAASKKLTSPFFLRGIRPGLRPIRPARADVFPDFNKETSQGPIPSFHAWKGDSWAMFCSHPADFTPVCTTELGELAKRMPQFEERNCKVIALSVNDTESHAGWIGDIQVHSGTSGDFPYPIIADTDRTLMHSLGMIDEEEVDAAGNPMTCRAVFIVGTLRPQHRHRFLPCLPRFVSERYI